MNMIRTRASAPVGMHVPRSQTLLWAGATGTVWRVQRGAFRLERAVGDALVVVHLALPGDLLGAEVLCDKPYSCSASAVVDSQAVPEPIFGNTARDAALRTALLQHQRQAYDMVQLRNGPGSARVGHLVHLLTRFQADAGLSPERKQLPPLRDMAQIVDAAPETVCRELKRLMPELARTYRPRAHRTAFDRAVDSPVALTC